MTISRPARRSRRRRRSTAVRRRSAGGRRSGQAPPGPGPCRRPPAAPPPGSARRARPIPGVRPGAGAAPERRCVTDITRRSVPTRRFVSQRPTLCPCPREETGDGPGSGRGAHAPRAARRGRPVRRRPRGRREPRRRRPGGGRLQGRPDAPLPQQGRAHGRARRRPLRPVRPRRAGPARSGGHGSGPAPAGLRPGDVRRSRARPGRRRADHADGDAELVPRCGPAVPGAVPALERDARRGRRSTPQRVLLVMRACDGASIAPLFEGPLAPRELATTRDLLLRLASDTGPLLDPP